MEKNDFCDFLRFFQFLEISEKKIINNEKNEKKNIFEQKNFDGLLPRLYCERRKKFVLQEGCIAGNKVVRLYCKVSVLAYNCIAVQFTVLQEKAGKAELYRNTTLSVAA